MIAIEDEPVRGLRARVESPGRLHPCDQTHAVSLEILGDSGGLQHALEHIVDYAHK